MSLIGSIIKHKLAEIHIKSSCHALQRTNRLIPILLMCCLMHFWNRSWSIQWSLIKQN